MHIHKHPSAMAPPQKSAFRTSRPIPAPFNRRAFVYILVCVYAIKIT